MRAQKATSRYRSDQAKNLVGFLVGDVRYAVEIAQVREIVNPLPVVALPHVPAEVVGVSDHRGQVVPVVDLRTRLGLSPEAASRRTKWLIVDLRGLPVALTVDAVTEVFGASASEDRQAPELGRGDEQRGIARVVRHLGNLVFVMDPARVASAADQVDPRAAQLAVDSKEKG